MRASIIAVACILPFAACDEEQNGEDPIDLDARAMEARDMAPPPAVDAAPPDRRDDCYQPCEQDSDCRSRRCIRDPNRDQVCTCVCGDGDDCPPGFECDQVSNDGPDTTFVCVPRPSSLCELCNEDADCLAGGTCIEGRENIAFCGHDCAEDGFCPRGFSCESIGEGQQCVPAEGQQCGECLDADRDGYGDGPDCRDVDCDDENPDVHPGARERCDGQDDDCDGLTDEREGRESAPDDLRCVQAGVCAGAEPGCVDGAWGCVNPSPAYEEDEQSCDGLDNDCNGIVDDVEGRGAMCSAGLGACERAGIQQCDPAFGQLVCTAVPGQPVDEVCNEVDDDCDGIVDDVPGYGEPCESGQGRCRSAGEMRCSRATRRLECSAALVEPDVEACDGLDNDCDGIADEGVLNACGGCGPPPAEMCNREDDDCDGSVDEGVANPCGGCGAPPPEQCNTLDDDCDGRVDEGTQNACGACGPVPVEACDDVDNDCDGAIDEGTQNACGGCGPAPEEACDNADNDCDGRVDEDVTRVCFDGHPQEAGVGACREGTSRCDAGEWGPCEDQVLPVDDACNGEDDDCDGASDEDHPVGAPCEAGVGVCLRPGFLACDGVGVSCASEPGRPDLEDADCDGEDQDCDGTADEDYPSPEPACGVGECATRSTPAHCRDGAPQGCEPGEPEPENCNELDDDCDGVIDEGVQNRCGACGPEPAEVCNEEDDDCDGRVDEGLANRCGGCGPEPDEICNNQDDDCDGQVDEALSRPCDSACGQGTEQCRGGEWGGCNAPPPMPEVCNETDDDCDGRIDEGVLNACGACGPVPAEICDRQDNDCDGAVDEAVLNACGACGPTPVEVCDRQDNDCDGRTDEGVDNRCGGCGPEPAEICNGQDDDCDGRTDEALFRPCESACGQGDEQCVAGRWERCDAPQPQPEDCNRQDDDCDGRTDEGVMNACGECGAVPRESCNFQDDDCDGRTDEGVRNRCDDCGPEPQEQCNFRDDDCDGRTDEGVTNRCGDCGPEPREICNGRDDDCDGRSDEGVANRCGDCGPEPEEICNGRDDDCDGRTDEGGFLCGGGDLCVRGRCCDDADGDGHADQRCGGDDCDDGDRYKYPGNREVLDIRDNDCNGQADDVGLVRLNRYFREWSPNDWEHRFARNRPANFEFDGHWVDLYPTDVCSGPFRPQDRCDRDGAVIRMTHGNLVGLMQCTGILGQHHVSLSLQEDSGEYQDQRRVLSCTRIGYVYGGVTWRNVAGGTVQFYRHRSGFGANGKGDNMWSTDPDEGHPLYDQHGAHWRTKRGN